MSGEMTNIPLVSVIMNCYNSSEFLEEAIKSVLIQSYEKFELVFWDNQSTDKSAEIVRSFNDDRIKYYYAPCFTTLGIARNLAVEKAHGEWIGFLDADDLWHKDKIKHCVENLKEQPDNQEVSLIYNKTIAIDKNGHKIGEYKRYDSGKIHNLLLEDGNFIVQSSIMVRKDIFSEMGGVDTSLAFCPDYDLLLKVTKNGIAIGVDEFLTSYRVHDGSITATKELANYSESIDYLKQYINETSLSFFTRLSVFKNIIYYATAIMFKMLINADILSVIKLLKRYWPLFILSPFVLHRIILNRFIGRIGN